MQQAGDRQKVLQVVLPPEVAQALPPVPLKTTYPVLPSLLP